MIERAIDIGIEKIELIREMTKLLTFADTKEDFIYICERMHDEIEDGIAEIDRMLLQNRGEIS